MCSNIRGIGRVGRSLNFGTSTLGKPLGAGKQFQGCVVSYEAKPLPSQNITNLGIVGTGVNNYYYSQGYCVVKEFSTYLC